MRKFFFVVAMMMFALQSRSALAETILTIVSGEETVAIQKEDFASLGTVTVTTGTDWTDGVSIFRGPLVRDVLKFAGFEDSKRKTITATASNDYSVEIPVDDFSDYEVILATEMDGKNLTLRDKGPLWIVYPRDDHSELDDPVVNARWIWQLVALRVK